MEGRGGSEACQGFQDKKIVVERHGSQRICAAFQMKGCYPDAFEGGFDVLPLLIVVKILYAHVVCIFVRACVCECVLSCMWLCVRANVLLIRRKIVTDQGRGTAEALITSGKCPFDAFARTCSQLLVVIVQAGEVTSPPSFVRMYASLRVRVCVLARPVSLVLNVSFFRAFVLGRKISWRRACS